ncbi:MAG: YihY/virulence factor BrkB family protein [Gaiellaceae bacterium]
MARAALTMDASAHGQTGESEAPTPQPEHSEPRISDPSLRDLTLRDWVAIFQRAGKETVDDDLPVAASALAYSSFFAIPSTLLLAVGAFSLVATPDTISELMDRFGTFMPSEATELLGGSLQRLEQRSSTGILMTIVGLLLALWGSTSAMTTYMKALNTAYDRTDGRSFVRKRLIALSMVVAIGAATVLVGLLLVFGPYLERWLGRELGLEGAVPWVWWTVQWPLLVAGLLTAFAVLHYFAPDVEHRHWRFVTPGALVAVVVWLVASGGFSVYASMFGSYNKAWGSFSAVIVTLTWLWLTGLALLFGGEVNAEVERSRELRTGTPASSQVLAPRRSEQPE